MEIFAVNYMFSTSDHDSWMFSIESQIKAYFSTREKAEKFVKEELQKIVDALNSEDYESWSEYQEEVFRILINNRDYMVGENGEDAHSDVIFYIEEINVR